MPTTELGPSVRRPGRPCKPLSLDDRPVLELSRWLRSIKDGVGKTFREISEETNYSLATLNAACRGDRLPSWTVVLAFARACQGDEKTARELYAAACVTEGRELPGPVDPPDPTGAVTAAEFVSCMRQLRLWALSPSLAELNRRSGGHLPPSTLSEVLRRDALPRQDLLGHFVRVCRLPSDRAGEWDAAWRAIKARDETSMQKACAESNVKQSAEDAEAKRSSAGAPARVTVPRPRSWLAFLGLALAVVLFVLVGGVNLAVQGIAVQQAITGRGPTPAHVETDRTDTSPADMSAWAAEPGQESTGTLSWSCTQKANAAPQAAGKMQVPTLSVALDTSSLTLGAQSSIDHVSYQGLASGVQPGLHCVIHFHTSTRHRSAPVSGLDYTFQYPRPHQSAVVLGRGAAVLDQDAASGLTTRNVPTGLDAPAISRPRA